VRQPEPGRWAEPDRWAEPGPWAEPSRQPEPGRWSDPARQPAPVAKVETREEWLQAGRKQFDYLISQGLQPGDRMLEIGCGNLRAGHLFIDYLSAGNYYGIDASPENLIAAQQVVTEFGLQAKMPHLSLFSDLRLGFLPPSRFTVVQAESAFANSPVEVIGECLAHISRVMTRDAIFDFTVDRSQGAENPMFRKNFRFRTDTLIGLANSCNLDAELVKDWEQQDHSLSKIRVTRRS
jgi:SAM-dependent methyltransferase